MNTNDWRSVLRNDRMPWGDRPPEGEEFRHEEMVASLRARNALNALLGARRNLLRHALPLVQAAAARHHGREEPVSILDLGTGGADLPRALAMALRRRKIGATIDTLELNRDVAAYARAACEGFPEVRVQVGDFFALEAKRESYDVVLASRVLHRFERERALHLLGMMARMCRVGFVALDVRRHPLGCLGFAALATALPRCRTFRREGIAALRATYTLEEWADLAERTRLPGITLWPHWPFRVALTWRR